MKSSSNDILLWSDKLSLVLSPARGPGSFFIKLITLALLAWVLSGCAEGDPLTTESDASEIADIIGPEEVTTPPDTGAPPTPPPTPDTGPTPTPICTPGEVQCLSETMRGVCTDDGTGFEEESCGSGTQCVEGQCQSTQACTPNHRYCHDGQNLLTCRANGSGYTTQQCGDGNVCIGDACFTGLANGAPCNLNDDCAGQRCHCGSEESCPSSLTPAYCTQTCDANSCNNAEWCLDAAQLGGAHHYDHCVNKCDAACSIAGLGCKYIPVKGVQETTWEQGCVHRELAGIGEVCTSDAQCLGGTCLQDYFGFGYCTRRCESGGCPSGSACVQLRGNEHWCSLLCGDGVTGQCPLKLTRPNDLNITCKLLSEYDSDQAVRVCTRT